MKRNLVLLVGFVLTAAACGGGDGTATSPAGADPTLAPATTSTSPPTTAATTFTIEAYGISDDPATDGDAAFILSEVVFGDDGHVAVTNTGKSAGSLSGFWFCQRPSYFEIGEVSVAGGETVYFTAGSGAGLDGQIVEAGSGFGRLQASSGEMGLYKSGSFSSSDAIVSYVEWGSGSHGRSSVAVEAGIWDSDDFVATDDSSTSLFAGTADPPTSSADWTTN